jgi:hypothetical protein
VPANGYLDSTGNGWKCDRGFKQEDTACTALNVPANAYIDYSGNGWHCEDGFHKQGALCGAN